jgi:hypothetical protein
MVSGLFYPYKNINAVEKAILSYWHIAGSRSFIDPDAGLVLQPR